MDNRTLQHRIEELPDELLGHLRMGFELLRQAAAPDREAFFVEMLERYRDGSALDRKKASELLKTSEKIVGDALAATSLAIGIFADLDVTPEEYVKIGTGRLFQVDDRDVAIELATLVAAKRVETVAARKLSRLGQTILPSFSSLDTQIDLRLSFDDNNNIDGRVPVVIAYLSTDVDEDLRFQMTEAQLLKLKQQVDVVADLLLQAKMIP